MRQRLLNLAAWLRGGNSSQQPLHQKPHLQSDYGSVASSSNLPSEQQSATPTDRPVAVDVVVTGSDHGTGGSEMATIDGDQAGTVVAPSERGCEIQIRRWLAALTQPDAPKNKSVMPYVLMTGEQRNKALLLATFGYACLGLVCEGIGLSLSRKQHYDVTSLVVSAFFAMLTLPLIYMFNKVRSREGAHFGRDLFSVSYLMFVAVMCISFATGLVFTARINPHSGSSDNARETYEWLGPMLMVVALASAPLAIATSTYGGDTFFGGFNNFCAEVRSLCDRNRLMSAPATQSDGESNVTGEQLLPSAGN